MQVFSSSNNQADIGTLGISTGNTQAKTTQDRHIRLNKILAVNNKPWICAYIQAKSTFAQAVRCICAASRDCQRQYCNDRCDFLHFQNPHN